MTDKIKLDYNLYISDAMRLVAKKSLEFVVEHGFYDNHHFYISFLTSGVGVDIPDFLRQEYPNEMTIVLQHQYYDLAVHDDYFEVSLSFHKKLQKLTIPFSSIVSFSDPAVNLMLRFQAGIIQPTNKKAPAKPKPQELPENAVQLQPKSKKSIKNIGEFNDKISIVKPKAKTEKPPKKKPSEDNIIVFDKFRKK